MALDDLDFFLDHLRDGTRTDTHLIGPRREQDTKTRTLGGYDFVVFDHLVRRFVLRAAHHGDVKVAFAARNLDTVQVELLLGGARQPGGVFGADR